MGAGIRVFGYARRGRSRFTPYGWRTADGMAENVRGDRRPLVPHADEQAALARLVELRDAGQGARRIAKALGNINPRSGQPWTVASVSSILDRLDRWEAAGVDPMAAA